MGKRVSNLRLLSYLLIILTVFITVGCSSYQDAGIIRWSYNDDILEWKDVPNATYYQLMFYESDLVTPISLVYYNYYAYDSNFSFFDFPKDDYNLKILVFYEDENYDESEIISITINRNFEHVKRIGVNYLGNSVSWPEISMNQSDSDFTDYTIRINEEEFNIDEANYSLADYEAGIYKIQVRANYTEGVSIWSKPFYAIYKMTSETINVYYDTTSNENFRYSFPEDEEVQAVLGVYNIALNVELPNQIVDRNASDIEINRYYIENEGKMEEVEYLQIIISFTIITDKSVYRLNLTNLPITN